MPRTITEVRTVYKFEELNERAQQRAVEGVAEKLGGAWWDQHDNDDIAATMVYTFAEKLGTPGWEEFGVGDFPGIPGVKLDEWDLGRAQSITFVGTLDRENAPALPWAYGVEAVTLGGKRGYGIDQRVYVETDGEAEVTEWAAVTGAAEIMKQDVEAAAQDAWKAGEKEADYKGGEEYAREWIEANEPDFTEDGDLDR